MPNEITLTETNKVTKELCVEYIKSQNTALTEGEFAQYSAVAIALNLNPFLREIYPIKYGKEGKMTLVTGYQVYIKRAEEFPQYDGYEIEWSGAGKELRCTCKVFRKDRSRPTSATVFLTEYHQGNAMWNNKPHVMLEKVAIGTAFRRAFPCEFGGMPYTAEEVRGEDILQQNGYTEVQADPETPPAKDWHWLQNRLKEMGTEDKKAYDLVAENIKAQGWNGLKAIPTDRYDDIESWYATAKVVSKMEDKINPENTAEESTSAETEKE